MTTEPSERLIQGNDPVNAPRPRRKTFIGRVFVDLGNNKAQARRLMGMNPQSIRELEAAIRTLEDEGRFAEADNLRVQATIRRKSGSR